MNTNYLYASHYYKLGLNVTCISNELNMHNFYCRNILKNPDHEWKSYFNKRQTESELNGLRWDTSIGVGTVTGYSELLAIDIDGCTNYSILKEILSILGLSHTYEWVTKTGSNNGFQILCLGNRLHYIDNDIVASTYPSNINNANNFEKIEFLWQTHLVLPPSLHKSGNRYQFINCKLPTSGPVKVGAKNIVKLIAKYLDSKLEKHGIDYGFFDEKTNQFVSNIVEIKTYHPTVNFDSSKFEAEPEISKAHCIIDIETNKLISQQDSDIEYPTILQIAWILMDDEGKILKRLSTLIKPDHSTINYAANINKIDLSVATQIGLPLQEALSLLAIDLNKSSSVIAHNTDFDLKIIMHYFEYYGIYNTLISIRKYCTMKDPQYYYNIVFGVNKFMNLSELYEKLFGTKPINAHNAENDVLITAKCYRHLLKKKIAKSNN